MNAASKASDSTTFSKNPASFLTRIRRVVDVVGLGLAVLAIAGAAIIVAVYGMLALRWQTQPFLGVMYSQTLVVENIKRVSDGAWPAYDAGLQPGDRITGIDDIVLPEEYQAAQRVLNDVLSSSSTGERIDLVFERADDAEAASNPLNCVPVGENGDVLSCSIEVALTHLPLVDFLGLFGLGYGVGVGLLVLAVGTILRRWQFAAARQIAALCAALAIISAGVFDTYTTYTFTVIWTAAAALAAALMAVLALTFPGELDFLRRQPWLRFLPLLPAALVIIIAQPYFYPDAPALYLRGREFAAVCFLLGLLVLLLSMGRRLGQTLSATVRGQTAVVLVGGVLLAIPLAAWLTSVAVEHTFGGVDLSYDFSWNAPFMAMFALGLLYAVSRGRLPDSEDVLGQGMVYGAMAMGLTVGYWLLVTGLSVAFSAAFPANNPLLIAIVVFVMAALFVPVRTFLERRINTNYLRTRYSYRRRVEALIQALTDKSAIHEIVEVTRQTLHEALEPTHLLMYFSPSETGDFVTYGAEPETDIRFERYGPLARYLAHEKPILYLDSEQTLPPQLSAERSRLAVLNAPLIVPLYGQQGLTGILMLGERTSGERYGYDELQFIQNIGDQVAMVVERAQVVDNLQQKVQELNVLGQVAQAVNFTIEFDDLLELIYAQSSKIITASHFYIALRDPNTDELYYAFYSENDERISEREGVRWRMGRDLLSDIVRTRQPLLLENYGTEAERREGLTVLDNPNLKAWMGVPLNAQTTTLGVIAAGIEDANVLYNDEQLKVLWQIADQAAIAIDKARLYDEAQNRARQLAALNEISTQIATVFQDPDQLLELITESAVQILNAETGSLLMVVPDTGELEFKVVIGSEKDELLNKRLPAGTGVVGAVADRGEPVIVNDTLRDPRWYAGVDAEVEFRTSSLLAVPLIGSTGVMGVLEIINKAGGGVFVEEDKNILTTFAGQASIALENARLFQMTDQQLAARVDELDTMQRIDRELNETLQLDRVVDITMDWAMRESGARAGALYAVRDEPQGLEMVAHYGYPEEIVSGHVNTVTPLDQGVVGRVVNSGNPELVADVRLDRSNVPLFPNAACQMAVPLISGGHVDGVILLESDEESKFSLLDLDFVSRLAEHASPALTNSRLFSQLEYANEERSKFVSFVAHELKNPLTSMRGYTSFLLEGAVGPFNEQQRNFLNIILRNVERMATLVKDLEDVTKLETGRMQLEKGPVKFYNVVVETLRPLQKQIEDKRQRVHVEVPERLPAIYADQSRLIQVMTNLLSNAHKYTPPEGDITVIAEPADNIWDPDGPSRVLHVRVQDTGIGMSEEDQIKLFTPYFRSANPLAREQPGTGLGLVIVRGIVEQHMGQIWVESQLEVGTTFHLTFPLLSAVPEAQTDLESVAAG